VAPAALAHKPEVLATTRPAAVPSTPPLPTAVTLVRDRSPAVLDPGRERKGLGSPLHPCREESRHTTGRTRRQGRAVCRISSRSTRGPPSVKSGSDEAIPAPTNRVLDCWAGSPGRSPELGHSVLWAVRLLRGAGGLGYDHPVVDLEGVLPCRMRAGARSSIGESI
jgi:hypothetical protein